MFRGTRDFVHIFNHPNPFYIKVYSDGLYKRFNRVKT